MLYLKKGTVNKVFLTLADLQTLTGPHYLFIFENRATKETAAWVENASGDVSLYKSRYNAFMVNVNARLGVNATPGTWNFRIYEQPSTTNIDPELATGLLESGLAQVEPPADTSPFTRYEPESNLFKVYSP